MRQLVGEWHSFDVCQMTGDGVSSQSVVVVHVERRIVANRGWRA